PPRRLFAMAYDKLRQQMVVFGGYQTSAGGTTLNDTWVWDGSNWTQKFPPVSPPPRAVHAIAYDDARGEIVLFGGSDVSGNRYADTWTWDGSTWMQKFPVNSPQGRVVFNGMAYDAGHAQIVLFGGNTGVFPMLDDTWIWDGTNWTQKFPTSRPLGRDQHAMAYDAARGQVMLFGGTDEIRILGDTWIWDGFTWMQEFPSTTPPFRGGHAVAYDADRAQIVM